jgi:hypothetical protein
LKLFGNISKVNENDDGTLTVSGIASSESIDSDDEIILADAIKNSIGDYMKFGALREMHQNIAAGTTLSMKVSDDGKTEIEALVVDPVSVKKVLAGQGLDATPSTPEAFNSYLRSERDKWGRVIKASDLRAE